MSSSSAFFPDIQEIAYKPARDVSFDGNATTTADELCYRHYNPEEVLLGKPMKDWLKFSICFW
jgi:xylose isomerase